MGTDHNELHREATPDFENSLILFQIKYIQIQRP